MFKMRETTEIINWDQLKFDMINNVHKVFHKS